MADRLLQEDGVSRILLEDGSGFILLESSPAVLPLSTARETFYYAVEIRNKTGQLVRIEQKDISSLMWEYDSEGGCGECGMVLRREFDNYGDLGLDYDVQIWRLIDPRGTSGATLPATLPLTLGTSFTGARELRYSGFVRELQPIFSETESVRLGISGYIRQAEYLIIPNVNYAGMDIGAIARSIVDTYVLPGSQIKRTAGLGLMSDTGVSVSGTGLRFFVSASQALQTLAEIGGNAEWGVRADKEFVFKPRTTAVNHGYILGNNVRFFAHQTSTDEIVNRVWVQGAAATYQINGASYQSGFQKERAIMRPSIQTSSDAVLWGVAYFSRFGTVQPKGRIVIAGTADWIERQSHPLGLLRVLGGPKFLESGSVLPATLPLTLGKTYGGKTDTNFRIATTRYTPSENGLDIEIELGEKRGRLADRFRAIEFKLDQLRQGVA